MSAPQENGELAQKRPDHELVALLQDRHAADAVAAELGAIGLDLAKVMLLHGPEGVTKFDYDGVRHGWYAHARRALKNVGGADANILLVYLEGLRHGRFLIFVPLPAHRSRHELVDILRQHDAHAISYFTPGTMETIPTLRP